MDTIKLLDRPNAQCYVGVTSIENTWQYTNLNFKDFCKKTAIQIKIDRFHMASHFGRHSSSSNTNPHETSSMSRESDRGRAPNETVRLASELGHCNQMGPPCTLVLAPGF